MQAIQHEALPTPAQAVLQVTQLDWIKCWDVHPPPASLTSALNGWFPSPLTSHDTVHGGISPTDVIRQLPALPVPCSAAAVPTHLASTGDHTHGDSTGA